MSNRKREEVSWPSASIFIVSKIVDTGLAPIAVIGAIAIGCLWVFARQLESGDSLKFLTTVVSIKGVGGMGIVLSILQPFLFFKLQKKWRGLDRSEIDRLNRLVNRYEKQLTDHQDLRLETEQNK